MTTEKRKAMILLLFGIAVMVIPFLIRMKGQDSVIGIVEIPSLGLKYPVFEGAGEVQLNESIGHMESKAPLCARGNCVLAGYNGSRRGIYFTNLGNIKAGAKVKLTNKDNVVHEYTVDEIRVVNPYDEWVTEESGEEMLTLFTCAEHGTRRFVCRCVPVMDYDRKGGETGGRSTD